MSKRSSVKIDSVSVGGVAIDENFKLDPGLPVTVTYSHTIDDVPRRLRASGAIRDDGQFELNTFQEMTAGSLPYYIPSFAAIHESQVALIDPKALAKAIELSGYDEQTVLPRIDWSAVEFPSDHLSLKRLRTAFPRQFDTGGALTDHASIDFFHAPDRDERPNRHLDEITALLFEERTLVEYAFYKALDSVHERCSEWHEEARHALVPLFMKFKLADSPETARLLIQNLEEQGTEQAKQVENPRSRAL